MAKRKVLLSLDDTVADAIDSAATQRGVTRSALVTRLAERAGLVAPTLTATHRPERTTNVEPRFPARLKP